MIEISPQVVTILMLAGILLGILTGFPLAIPIGALALIVGFLLFGAKTFDIIYMRFFSLITNYILVAVPLFVFMGEVLERSGIAGKMYDALYLWFGGLRGGLAITTILVGTLLAACVGIIGASVTMLSLVALPAMVNRGYDKGLATGAVCAGGTLGILIPPSIMLVIYGPMALISVGKLFMAAFFPGFLLSALYCVYITIRCFLEPQMAPAVPPEERGGVSFAKKTTMLIGALAPTGFLVLAVLGVIYLGIAPPTQAAGVGALAAVFLAMGYRKLNLKVLKEACISTMKLTSMVLLIGGSAYAFVGIFLNAGAGNVIKALLLASPGGAWGIFAVIMLLFFILGFFMDWIAIFFILLPVVTPLVPQLGFDPIWFALMICVNLQTSFMTPPFAGALFFVMGSAPPELGITMADIIRGVIPFVIMILIGLGLLVAFPEIILWLPAQMIK